MAIDPLSNARSERRWAFAMVGAAMMMLFAIVWASLSPHMNPPSNIENVDPNTLHIAGEFTEDNLGTQVDAKGRVTTRIVTSQFSFAPECVVVPQDMQVTFRFVSPDVIHGLLVVGTNINTMVVPGYVSQVHTMFDKPGDMLMPCHEFCGLGHSQMVAHVRVVPIADFKPDENGRVACAEH